MSQPDRSDERRPVRLRDLCERWGVSEQTLWRRRREAGFPSTFKLGAFRYCWSDELAAYEEARAAVGAAAE